MTAAVRALATLEELQKYVHETLCGHDYLEPAHSPLFQSLIKRSGPICGLFFQVMGPRSVRLYAVWTGEEDRILFYDSIGLRFAETRLSEAPDITGIVEEPPSKMAA
jgi:hypothetical protein